MSFHNPVSVMVSSWCLPRLPQKVILSRHNSWCKPSHVAFKNNMDVGSPFIYTTLGKHMETYRFTLILFITRILCVCSRLFFRVAVYGEWCQKKAKSQLIFTSSPMWVTSGSWKWFSQASLYWRIPLPPVYSSDADVCLVTGYALQGPFWNIIIRHTCAISTFSTDA